MFVLSLPRVFNRDPTTAAFDDDLALQMQKFQDLSGHQLDVQAELEETRAWGIACGGSVITSFDYSGCVDANDVRVGRCVYVVV